MAKLYVDKVFHETNRAPTIKMLEDLREQFLVAMLKESWMSHEDRQAGQAKLKNMFFQVAYPTDENGMAAWPRQATVLDARLHTKTYLLNFILTQRAQIDEYFRQLEDGTVNRLSWGDSSPLSPNAFYSPTQNGLFVSAGILQSPFLHGSHHKAEADDLRGQAVLHARNFGSIGSILGHEMSHGFDESGRQVHTRL